MEHGALHIDDHVDPNDMYNMGGLKSKMPITFWTFVIGGFALSGFPVLTAGFWSKDEILSDAFAHGHWAVFLTLALAALLTAFYTMRQISLTFLGKPRSKAAEHAHETPWTMTLPLVILAFFALAYGWVGIPEHFPGIGGLIPNWFHDFVASTLPHHPSPIPFSWIPLLTSLVVALGGLSLGWFVYRNIQTGDEDPLKKVLGRIYTVLENKYYVDEFYNKVFIQPAYWIAETFTYKWMDRGVIDGFLHGVSRLSYSLGGILRNYIDVPVINGFGDFLGEGVKKLGRALRVVQTGRVQQYMIIALVLAFATLFYYLFNILLP
jgi:NADH-quinone oxidoreductase subunit L